MDSKGIAIRVGRFFCIIISLIMFSISMKNFFGFGALKIYADGFSYWISSFIPLGVSKLFIIISIKMRAQ